MRFGVRLCILAFLLAVSASVYSQDSVQTSNLSTVKMRGRTSAPPLSTVGNAIYYFDIPSGHLKASENGGAYTNMVGGGGGGTGQPGGSPNQVQYQIDGTHFGGISSATTDGTVVTQLAGADFVLADPTAPTKHAHFVVSGVTAGQDRAITVPDAPSTLVVSDTGAANSFITAISATGAISKARPTFANLTSTPTTFSGYGIVDNSAGLLSAVADATGTGLSVFNQSPVIVTPTIASFLNAQHNHSNAAGGGTIAFGSLTSTPTTLSGYGITDGVPTSRTVAGHPLSTNVTITCGDLSNSSGGCTMSTTGGGDLSGTLPSPTVAKVNGISYPATGAAHSVPVVTTANSVATYKAIPDCQDSAGNHLNYTQSTDLFSCGTSGGGGGSGTVNGGTATHAAFYATSTTAVSDASRVIFNSGGTGVVGITGDSVNGLTVADSSGQPLVISKNNARIVFQTDGVPAMTLQEVGNLLLGTTTGPSANGGKVLGFGDNTNKPTLGASTAAIYAKTAGGNVNMFVQNSAGTETQISPHNFSLIPGGPSEPDAWSFYSETNGRVINVDMLRVVRLLEQLTGEKLVYIGRAH